MPTDVLTSLPVKTKYPGDVAVFLVDGTSPANKASVDSFGNQSTKLAAGSNLVGSIAIDQTVPGVSNVVEILQALPAGTNLLGAVRIDQTTPGTTNAVQITGPGTTAQNPIYTTTMTASGLGSTSNNPEYVELVAGSALVGKFDIDQTTPGVSNGVQVNAPLPIGANSIGTVGLNSGTNIIGIAGINQTTPGVTNGVQITGPGTTLSNPIYVSTEPDPSTILSSGQLTSASLAIGSNVTLNAPTITNAKRGALKHVVASSSIPLKVEIQSIQASTATTFYTMFTSSANPTICWQEIALDELLTAASDGTTRFAVNLTNMDNTSAADVYATLVWAEV